MNKRELMLGLLAENEPLEYTPAGFFLHFDPPFHRGQAAIDKHLEFFHATNMDFIKIQYEQPVTEWMTVEKIEDWTRMPRYDEDFFAGMLEVVDGLVKSVKAEALVLVTLYSPFMWARRVAGDARLTQHIRENQALVQQGMEAITASVRTFVQACVHLGVDGFYASTQGGEAQRFPDVHFFETCVKPYDLSIMHEINQTCVFNILHICDYQGSYDDLTRFLDYPGHVVNSPLQMGNRQLTPQLVAAMFDRPFMGGMERLGVIASGNEVEVRHAAATTLHTAPRRFILGADCTVPSETPWANLRAAIDTAHQSGNRAI
jgi:uroporphyrinogen decarboxylase